jgi:hypothetical protein
MGETVAPKPQPAPCDCRAPALAASYLARISHDSIRIGVANRRKWLCSNDFRAIRGAPRCRKSVAQTGVALNCLSLRLSRVAALWRGLMAGDHVGCRGRCC